MGGFCVCSFGGWGRDVYVDDGNAPKTLNPPLPPTHLFRFDGQDQLVPFRMQAKYATQPLETLAVPAQPTATGANPAAGAAAAADPDGGGDANDGITTPAAAADQSHSTTTTTTTQQQKPPPPIVEAVPARVDAQAKLVTYERYCHVYRCVCFGILG